ncbi:MAG: hypothetical protein JKY50_12185 [Oleispira sp.]|nr:hypothetical protein [Oleispira sp.]
MSTKNNSKAQAIIKAAREAIEALGWVIDEDFSDDGKALHLVLTKCKQRLGWGMFEPSYCWAEAYQKITGRSWIELIGGAS